MKAEEARKLTFAHSNQMKKIYSDIEENAKKGLNHLALFTSEASKEQLELLREEGYTAGYETSETDGGQFILIKW